MKVPVISYGKNTSKWDKKTNFANKFPNINVIRSPMTELQRMRKPLKQFFKNYEKPRRKWGMQLMSAQMKVRVTVVEGTYLHRAHAQMSIRSLAHVLLNRIFANPITTPAMLRIHLVLSTLDSASHRGC